MTADGRDQRLLIICGHSDLVTLEVNARLS